MKTIQEIDITFILIDLAAGMNLAAKGYGQNEHLDRVMRELVKLTGRIPGNFDRPEICVE